LSRIGLSEAEPWIEQQRTQLLEATPSTVLSRGPTLHVLFARLLERGRLRFTVRSLLSNLVPTLVDARVMAIGQTRGLSARETEVARLLLAGHSHSDIADALGITPRTVKFHQANILDKFGADSRFDLLRIVL
jgi:DNA-binding CsgD family transcriptional regulator